MGYISLRNADSLRSFDEKSFLGLNRGIKVSAGEFCDMQNMSSDEYPYIASRKPREKSASFNTIFTDSGSQSISAQAGDIRAVAGTREDTAPTGFCGVIGTTFYYNGKAKPMKIAAEYDSDGNYLYGMELAADGKIQLLWANRILIIHGYGSATRDPYIYYYDTDHENTRTDYVRSSEYEAVGNFASNTISFKVDGTGTMSFTYKIPTGQFSGGYFNFKVGDSVFIDQVMTYADSRWSEYSKSDITSATVTSYSETRSSTSGGYEFWNINIAFSFLNSKGKQAFDTASSRTIKHIYKKIPYMSQLALHKGRLWGANPNGEYVYASSIENLFDFLSFDGLSSDSAFLESSSQGGYLGVVSCGDALVTAKKNELEAIYGELPNEFAVGKSYNGCGCADIDSCVVIDNVLYFLGNDGFYMWNGSKPQLISKKLNTKYKGAFSFTDGTHYFASSESDKCENLVFDPRYGVWHKEDENKICGAFSYDGGVYLLIGGTIYKTDSGNEKPKWFAQSVRYFFDETDLKRINELWLKVMLDKDSKITVYASCGSGAWVRCLDSLTSRHDNEFKTIRVPVRLDEGDFWRYRIEGSGKCCIMGLKFIGDVGGRNYK